jgi:hypothetical protein
MAQLDTDIIKLLADNGIDYKDNVKLSVAIKELVIKYGTDDKCVQILKNELFTADNFKSGTKCRVCNQNVKMHKPTITKDMALCLINLYKLDKSKPEKIWWHVSSDIKVSFKVSGAFAKLRHWDLIEMMPKDSMNTAKRTSGMWRITDEGKEFVLTNHTVSKYIKLYNATLYGQEGEQVDIRSCLTEKFNYTELMNR